MPSCATDTMSPRLTLVTNQGTPWISARSWAMRVASTISAGYGGHSSSPTSGNMTSTSSAATETGVGGFAGVDPAGPVSATASDDTTDMGTPRRDQRHSRSNDILGNLTVNGCDPSVVGCDCQK